jgi:putative ABC transport system substrate-binding protein
MQHRTVAMLLIAVALLSSLGWSGESLAQTKIARVGILANPNAGTTDEAMAQYYEHFRRTLSQHDWIEGKNVSFVYRSAGGNPPQFAESVTELVKLNVDVIYANSAPAARAAYAATHSIPIVAVDYTNDPVAAGYAESYGRPGRNLTGFFLDAPDFSSKLLELVKAIVPRLSRVAVLWDPSPGAAHLQAVQGVARSFGVRLQVLEVHKPGDIETAFSVFRARTQALIILPSPMIYAQSARLAKLAMKHRMPSISMAAAFAEDGGTLSYGPNAASTFEQCAILVAKILAGAKPADLPIERPTKFDFIVNLKAAKAMGLTVPDFVLVRADKVIR